MRRDARSDQGDVLILALVFMLVVGLLGGAVASLAASSLGQTSVAQKSRAATYAAESAVQVAIQQVRATKSPTTALGYATGTINQNITCLAASSSPVPGTNISVTCNAAFIAPFVRSITFAGAANGATLVTATVTFDDVKSGCQQVTSTSSACFAPGTSVAVTNWDVTASDG